MKHFAVKLPGSQRQGPHVAQHQWPSTAELHLPEIRAALGGLGWPLKETIYVTGGDKKKRLKRMLHEAIPCYTNFNACSEPQVVLSKSVDSHFVKKTATSCGFAVKKVSAVTVRKPLCHCGRKADLKPATGRRSSCFASCKRSLKETWILSRWF